MTPENLNTQYQHQLVQHNTRTKQTRNNALSLSLAFYPFLSLFEEEENDDDDFTTTFIIIIIIITVVSTTRL